MPPELRPKPQPLLEELRSRVVEAFHTDKTGEVLRAACVALMEAGDPDPPPEARHLLRKWGYTWGSR